MGGPGSSPGEGNSSAGEAPPGSGVLLHYANCDYYLQKGWPGTDSGSFFDFFVVLFPAV